MPFSPKHSTKTKPFRPTKKILKKELNLRAVELVRTFQLLLAKQYKKIGLIKSIKRADFLGTF